MGRERNRAGQFIFLCIAGLIFFLLSGCTTLKKIFIPTREVPAEKVEKQPERPQPPPQPEFEGLGRAAQLFKQGDYDGSLKENQMVLSLTGKNLPGDRALFNMGLIYAHWENPKKDYENSLPFFNKIISDYPQSPLVEEAKLWVRVLQENEKLREVIENLEKAQKQPERPQPPPQPPPQPQFERLERAAQLFKQGDYDGSLKENQRVLSLAGKNLPKDRALFNLGLIYAHWENPEKDHEKSLLFFNKMISDYPQSPLVEEAKLWVRVLRENGKLREVIEKFKEVDIAVEEKKREKGR
ncbi:MAG: tetratricopeptide repeat protein [Deltaproteobacteria bacterium]|nr:tetratricopeptide repeat protein [Deltaproteobacteria bacterium]